MELQHRFTVPASVDTTWELVNDLEQIAPCFPGATLTSVEGDEFAGTVKVKVGPISLQYNGAGTFLERDQANHVARFEAKGKDKRGNGTAAATVRAVLRPDGAGTAVEVTTDLAVTGKPAQFGRGLMQDVSDKLLATFVDCLSERLTPAPDAGSADEPKPGPQSAPSPMPSPTTESSAAQATEPPAQPRLRPVSRQDQAEAALDLGATMLPVLARRYGPAVLSAVLVLLLLRRLRRR